MRATSWAASCCPRPTTWRSPTPSDPPAGGSAGRQAAARPRSGGRALLLLLDLQRDVDELVLLAADEATFARADEDLRRRHAVALGVALGVLEERRVATGVAEHHGLPV